MFTSLCLFLNFYRVKVKEYAVAFTLNNLLPSRVVELKPGSFSQLGIEDTEHRQIILARCNSSSMFNFNFELKNLVAVLRLEFDFETD
jgi:hypothetical protein